MDVPDRVSPDKLQVAATRTMRPPFWLRQELKESLCVSVCYKVLSLDNLDIGECNTKTKAQIDLKCFLFFTSDSIQSGLMW